MAGVISFAQMKLVQRRRKRTVFIRKLICSALSSQAKLLESAKWFDFFNYRFGGRWFWFGTDHFGFWRWIIQTELTTLPDGVGD